MWKNLKWMNEFHYLLFYEFIYYEKRFRLTYVCDFCFEWSEEIIICEFLRGVVDVVDFESNFLNVVKDIVDAKWVLEARVQVVLYRLRPTSLLQYAKQTN